MSRKPNKFYTDLSKIDQAVPCGSSLEMPVLTNSLSELVRAQTTPNRAMICDILKCEGVSTEMDLKQGRSLESPLCIITSP